jgi:predicted permease
MLLQDLRYALRQLRKAPGFTLTAVLTLALGIGACSTIGTWIRSTLFNPVPGASETGQMITIMRGDRSEHPGPPFSYPDFVDLRDNVQSLSGLVGYHDDFMSITGSATPRRIYGAVASADYFEVLGVRPILGQSLLASQANERAGAAQAVLSYDLWQNRFAADQAIVGKTIQINLNPYTIVGVAPKGFQGCKSGLRTDIWLPIGMDRQVWRSDRIEDRGAAWLNVLGVMKPGVDRRQVDKELNLLMQRIVDHYPTVHQGANQISSDPLWRSPFGANVYLAGTLPILLALAAVLLLLACANVANLLLVRSVSRRREFAIRLSMGASKWRLIRQLLIENLLVALAGGGVALIVTMWTARTLSAFLPPTSLPLSLNGRLDRKVLLATILVSILTAAFSGIVPALRASSLAPVDALKDEALSTSGGLQKSRLAGGLVIAQVALSLLLLACAGLFVRSLDNAQKSDPGFDPHGVLVASFDLSPLGYDGKTDVEFQRQLIARVKQLPGVQSAAVGDFSPLSFTIHSRGVLPEGYVRRPHETIEVDRGDVSPGYLNTLRTPLLAGRDFTDQDSDTTQPVAIVNQAFVDRYWPGQDALGKRIELGPGQWVTVVGIATNGKYRRLVNDPDPLVLYPIYQTYSQYSEEEEILHIRTAGDPLALTSALARTVATLNPNLPLFNVMTLQTSVGMGSVFQRIAAVFAGSFGLLALILAVVGIYGVVAYTTRQRTHEIGIRIALGASKSAIFRQVVGQGLRLTLAGLVVGVAVSLVLTRFLRGMLYRVGTTDWTTFTAVAVALCLVAVLACLIPARRAASVNPMQALRTE